MAKTPEEKVEMIQASNNALKDLTLKLEKEVASQRKEIEDLKARLMQVMTNYCDLSYKKMELLDKYMAIKEESKEW